MSRRHATALAALATVSLSACSSGEAGNPAATRSGDPAACPGEVVDVVVSVGQWGDVVGQLGGDCATVTTVVASAAVDPHDFEPGTSDIAAFSDADLVVLNGAGYDGWAESAVETLDPPPPVVRAADTLDEAEPAEDGESQGTDEHADEHGADPHLWYDLATVQKTATLVTRQLSTLSPDAADYFVDRARAWQDELAPLLEELAALREQAAGHSYAATETVFDRMAEAIGLTDVTPEGYRRAVSNESEPGPGDLAEFEAALAGGRVDVLVHNIQTTGSLTDQLVAAAAEADVPVVEVTESPPDTDGSFLAWQLGQLQELSTALRGIR